MKNRIVVYGLGKIWEQYKKYVDEEEIVAYADILPCKGGGYGLCVVSPEQISLLQYDYIVVFSKTSTEAIRESLIKDFSIPKPKIVDFEFYLFVLKKKVHIVSLEMRKELPIFWEEYGIKSVLDIDAGLYRMGILNRDEVKFCHEDIRTVSNMNINMDVWMVKESYRLIMNNIYSNVYDDFKKLSQYDLILMIDLFLYIGAEEGFQIIDKIVRKTRFVLLTLPCCYSEEYEKWETHDYSQWGQTVKINFGHTRGLLIKTDSNKRNHDTQIYVVTHKKYREAMDDVRVTIHAGRQNSLYLGYLGDETGDNISDLNFLLNECTAMYWVWKNARCKYVGIEHYRRRFIRNEYVYDDTQFLSECDVLDYMKWYDVIVAKHGVNEHYTVKETLKNSIHKDAFEMVYSKTENAIQKKQSQYLECFYEVMEGYTFYPCNLMIMPKSIYDCYCEWLFSILFEVLKDLDLSAYDKNSQRAVGFMAERLLTVWLLNQNYRIKELFFAYIE